MTTMQIYLESKEHLYEHWRLVRAAAVQLSSWVVSLHFLGLLGNWNIYWGAGRREGISQPPISSALCVVDVINQQAI